MSELLSAAPATRSSEGWRWDNSYTRLPALLHQAVDPTPVRAPRLVVFNRPLAEELGLDPGALDSALGADTFAGNRLPPGAQPIAQAYAGHQFGHFTVLGDGRAILLGEQITPGGNRYDVQLKGSGPTPYSRRGDGRAALGPMLREYVISEGMAGLGIPTTRSLAVAATGEEVLRDRRLPGAVLTRVAASHIRVGTFEWVAARGDQDVLRTLVDYTLRRHYPELAGAADPAPALLSAVIKRQARLIAQWLLVGFVHGVMNTDNMALSGETIDYGPCAFLDAYDPAAVFSSIDQHGRYAYANQPAIAQWNLTRLAETLLPFFDPVEEKAIEQAKAALEAFGTEFRDAWLAGLRGKLGLFNAEPDDLDLAKALLAWMEKTKADFTQTFVQLDGDGESCVDPDWQSWHGRWQARLQRQPQSAAESAELRRRHNPGVIPRNQWVETALAAAEGGDLGPVERLVAALRNPYDREQIPSEFRAPPAAGSEPYRTFCGT